MSPDFCTSFRQGCTGIPFFLLPCCYKCSYARVQPPAKFYVAFSLLKQGTVVRPNDTFIILMVVIFEFIFETLLYRVSTICIYSIYVHNEHFYCHIIFCKGRANAAKSIWHAVAIMYAINVCGLQTSIKWNAFMYPEAMWRHLFNGFTILFRDSFDARAGVLLKMGVTGTLTL